MIRSRFYSILSILLFSFTCQAVLPVSQQKERLSHKQAEESHTSQELLATVSLPMPDMTRGHGENILPVPPHLPVPDEYIFQLEYFFIKAETVLKNRYFQKGDGNKSPQNGEKAVSYSQYFSSGFFLTSINKSRLRSVVAQTKEEHHNIAQQIRAREWWLGQEV